MLEILPGDEHGLRKESRTNYAERVWRDCEAALPQFRGRAKATIQFSHLHECQFREWQLMPGGLSGSDDFYCRPFWVNLYAVFANTDVM